MPEPIIPSPMMFEPIVWTISVSTMLVFLALGYFCGSIPFGLILTRAFGLGDVRKIGSGNIGATNVLRTGNKKIAFATLVGDLFKGTIPVVIALRFGSEQALVAGLGAFLGHCWPVWLRFKGGKGVATYIGILFGLAPAIVPVFAVVWLASAFITRYSSLSALLASLATPIALYFFGYNQIGELFILLTFILWLNHRHNLVRLVKGEETRIGKKG